MHRKSEEEPVAGEPTGGEPGPRGNSELARSFRGWGDNAARRHLSRAQQYMALRHDRKVPARIGML
jgi:hypothetical protein